MMDTPNDEPQSSKDAKGSTDCHRQPRQHAPFQQQMEQQHLQHLQQQVQLFQQQAQLQGATSEEDAFLRRKRKLQAIVEQDECELIDLAATDAAYDADVDDEIPAADIEHVGVAGGALGMLTKAEKLQHEREHIYQLFQPWALKTYGDQAKTKTITMRKKARILKALEGKEHSRPDSSKFRFWVKSKAFTTRRPEGFEEVLGSQRRSKQLPPNAVLSDNPSDVDLFVVSTTKDFGRRTYRKVAVVEEFFDIIYNVHMELGGRSGMHAGQKRTYRIITETYAFLPREAVTRFLSTCPECKKNLRAISPSASSHTEEPPNESSSEVEVLNYSSHTESSLDAGPSATKPTTTSKSTAASCSAAPSKKRRSSAQESGSKGSPAMVPLEVVVEPPATVAPTLQAALPRRYSSPIPSVAAPATPTDPNVSKSLVQLSANVPRIRVNPQLQRAASPPAVAPREPVPNTPLPLGYQALPFDLNALKSHDSLLRYCEFMRRFYAGGFLPPQQPSTPATPHIPVLTPPLYGSDILQGMRFPPAALVKALATPTATAAALKNCATDDEADPSASGVAKKFKSSPESSSSSKAQTLAAAATSISPHSDTPTSTKSQTSAINLSKQLLFRSNGTPPPTTPTTSLARAAATGPTTSTPTSIKCEAPTAAKSAFVQQLRIPQVRGEGVAATATLPPLDMERLKPITSTYLQLTRSMGLSDEDALRFDNLFPMVFWNRLINYAHDEIKTHY